MEEAAKRIQEQAGQMQDLYEDGRRRVSDWAKSASENSKRAYVFTDQWVHENSWLALGLVAGAGLIIGLLAAQSFRED